MKILVLGGRGFIGRHLIPLLNSTNEVIEFSREADLLKTIIAKDFPDLIINCSASAPNATAFESFRGNLGFQMECLEALLANTRRSFKWVQIASYFELQISFGRDDYYTLHKQECHNLLKQFARKNRFELSTIYLPHIFGKGENIQRLIPSIVTSLQRGKITEISRGNQFLPILAVEDTCLAILAAMSTSQTICTATPIWYGRVKELAQIMEKAIGKGSIKANPERVSIDDKFPQVIFPPKVDNWNPKLTIEHFLQGLERFSGKES